MSATVEFNRKLDALAKSPDPGAALEAESMLRDRLGRFLGDEEEVIEGGEAAEVNVDADNGDDGDDGVNKVVRPDRFSFGAVIDAWARRSGGDAPDGPIRAEALLNEMRELSSRHEGMAPTTAEINATINAWSKSRLDDAPYRAEALLRDMHEEYSRGGGNVRVAPDAISFNTVIDAWANRCDGPGTVDAAGRAEDVLRLMQDYHASQSRIENEEEEDDDDDDDDDDVANGGGVGVGTGGLSRSSKVGMGYSSRRAAAARARARPNTRTYNAIIKAWSRAGSPERAGAVLQRMCNLRDGGNLDVKPDIYSYATVIDAWARTGAAERAEAVLTRMIEESSERSGDDDGYSDVGGAGGEGGGSVEPNTACYNAVISAWARSNNTKIAARRASSILERMEELSSENSNVRPNAITYGSVIHAWATSDERGAARRAEEVLRRMERRHEDEAESSTGDDGLDVRPNAVMYSSVINALARSEEKDSAQRAEFMLNRMRRLYESGRNTAVKPNAITYGSVINAYSRVGDAPRAEEMLRSLERHYDSSSSGDVTMKPNRIVYNTVINAWARSGRRDAADRAEAAFRHMQRRHEESGGDPDVAPDTISYNSVISAWSKCVSSSEDEKAARRAESILEVMENNLNELRHGSSVGGKNSVVPSVVSFGSVINAWANVGTADAARRAEAVLQRMLDISEAGAGGGTGMDVEIVPNTMCFNSVINAWARSGTPKQSIHAWNNLVRMEDLVATAGDIAKNVAPNSITYGTVVNACAFTPGGAGRKDKRKAMDIAVATMQKLETSTSVRPDHIVYGTFLKACENLLDDGEERERIAEGVFRRCCRDGQVDNSVLARFRAAAPGVYGRMFRGESIARKLPKEWRCNVRPVGRRHGQKRDRLRKERN